MHEQSMNNDKNMHEKKKDFLKLCFLTFGRVLGASDLNDGPLFGFKNRSLFALVCSKFVSILERFGRVWERSVEGLGKVWSVLEGFGRVWPGFGKGLRRFGELGSESLFEGFGAGFGFVLGSKNNIWGFEVCWDVQKVFGNFCLKFWVNNVFQCLNVLWSFRIGRLFLQRPYRII